MVFQQRSSMNSGMLGYWVENRLLRGRWYAQVRPRQSRQWTGREEFRGQRESDPERYTESTGFSDTLNQGGVEVREKQELYMTSRFIAYSTGKKKVICPLREWRRLQKNRYEVKGWRGHQEFMKLTGHPAGKMEETAGYSYLKFRSWSCCRGKCGINYQYITNTGFPIGKQQSSWTLD